MKTTLGVVIAVAAMMLGADSQTLQSAATSPRFVRFLHNRHRHRPSVTFTIIITVIAGGATVIVIADASCMECAARGAPHL